MRVHCKATVKESVVIAVQSCEMNLHVKSYAFTQTIENMLGNACHMYFMRIAALGD